MTVSAFGYTLNPRLDPERLAHEFARAGRLHVPEWLAGDAAERLYRFLRENSAWRLHINQGEKLFELDRTQQAALTPDAAAELDRAVNQAARYGFQFRFESIRISDSAAERAAQPSLLNDFARFLSSDIMLGFLRQVTGATDIDFADAQATAYGPGHFLTSHDDDVAGKNRRVAYVFNLTPKWRADWGGLLQFYRADGHVTEAYAPRFNALNIFAVPQPHSVSYVTPAAAYRRYSVTGWLRAGEVPR